MIRPDPLTRDAWRELAQQYHWLYGQNLQARLVDQREDITRWHRIGRNGGKDPGLR